MALTFREAGGVSESLIAKLITVGAPFIWTLRSAISETVGGSFALTVPAPAIATAVRAMNARGGKFSRRRIKFCPRGHGRTFLVVRAKPRSRFPLRQESSVLMRLAILDASRFFRG